MIAVSSEARLRNVALEGLGESLEEIGPLLGKDPRWLRLQPWN